MTVTMRWVWGTALLWTVFDVVSLAVGWGDLRGTGGSIIRMWFFAVALRCMAVPGGGKR